MDAAGATSGEWRDRQAIQADHRQITDGYKIEVGANVEESAKANTALAKVSRHDRLHARRHIFSVRSLQH